MARGIGRSRTAAPLASLDESFRVLRSNLSVALADLERPAVIVTSARPHEGKTATCAKLAQSFAMAGQRIVLVDLNLRHASAHTLVGAHNEFGVTDVLLGRRNLDESLQYVELGDGSARASRGLYFLGTGAPVSNPTELLGLGRTARMLAGLRREADFVLVDTPPVLPVADTLVLARISDGALLVVEARRTPIDAIQKSKDLLTRNQARLVGVVLNKFQQRDVDFGEAYGYGYGDTTTTHNPPEAPAARSIGNGARPG